MNKEDLARELNTIFGFKYRNLRMSKGYRLAGVVVKVLTKAVKTGQDVWIPGFGIFRWRTKPATRSTCGYFYGRPHSKAPQLLRNIPAKTYVHFKPSKVLLKFINGPKDNQCK